MVAPSAFNHVGAAPQPAGVGDQFVGGLGTGAGFAVGFLAIGTLVAFMVGADRYDRLRQAPERAFRRRRRRNPVIIAMNRTALDTLTNPARKRRPRMEQSPHRIVYLPEDLAKIQSKATYTGNRVGSGPLALWEFHIDEGPRTGETHYLHAFQAVKEASLDRTGKDTEHRDTLAQKKDPRLFLTPIRVGGSGPERTRIARWPGRPRVGKAREPAKLGRPPKATLRRMSR